MYRLPWLDWFRNYRCANVDRPVSPCGAIASRAVRALKGVHDDDLHQASLLLPSIQVRSLATT
jgi:hypothetical protein